MFHRLFSINLSLLVLALGLPALLSGCGGVSLYSDPPGAIIEYSNTGAPPWYELSGASNDLEANRTPYRVFQPFRGFRFLRARKDGYIPSERVLVDFSHPTANRITFDLLMKEEYEALLRLDEGYVFFEDQWVLPAEQGLVERHGTWITSEQAIAYDHQAAGEVLFDGEWIPGEDADAIQRERLLEQGFVEFKGQLVSPGDAERFETIDSRVDRLEEREDVLDAGNARLEHTGLIETGTRVKFFNATSVDVEILVSGPRTTSLNLPAYEDVIVELAPGTFRIGAIPMAAEIYKGFQGTFELDDRYSYTFIYLGIPFSERRGDQVLDESSRQKLEIPQLEIPEFELPEADPEGSGGSNQRQGNRGGGGGRGGGGRGPR